MKVPTIKKIIKHLKSDNWKRANLKFIEKALTELSHEKLLSPIKTKELDDGSYYQLAPKNHPEVVYRFSAKILTLEHWLIDPASIIKTKNNENQNLDAIYFLIEFKEEIGFSKEVFPVYLEEVSNTLYARAYLMNQTNDSKLLVDADYQSLESATYGHPIFLANNGRVGFNAIEYLNFAPEAGSDIRLIWVAGLKEHCIIAYDKDFTYENLMESELDASTRLRFKKIIQNKGKNPDDYCYMLLHPWQWYNKMNPAFAADLAQNHLIFLEESKDLYRAQQSIRTLHNISEPKKHYVKLSLSILNMGFIRGLPPYYAYNMADINNWINHCIKNDSFLQELGFNILREQVAVGYRNLYYESALENYLESPYTRMASLLWRESPVKMLEEGQRLITMAALLHIDNHEYSLLAEFIKKSKLEPKAWLAQYLKVYLLPVIHCFYKHHLAFMPHGENVILVMKNYIPIKMFIKDIAEEVAVMNPKTPLPKEIERISIHLEDKDAPNYIFIDVFDGFLRHLSVVFHQYLDLSTDNFWELIKEMILTYQKQHPDLQDDFKRFDLFKPSFKRSCLNRLQIKNNKKMISIEDPLADLQFFGMMVNPIG